MTNEELKQKTGLNLFTLSFRKDLEKEFQENYFNHSLRTMRICILIGLFIFAAFGFLDKFFINETITIIWIIRFAIFTPAYLGLFLFSFHKYFQKVWQSAISISVTLAGIAILAMMYFGNHEIRVQYHIGLILVMIYGFGFVRLRFIYSAISAVFILILFNILHFVAMHFSVAEIWSYNFNIISTIIISGFGAYLMEKNTRLNFISEKQIEEDKLKVTEINKMLEQKVKERTEELELANKKMIRAKQKAEQSDQLKTTFLSNMSHEIRTPMNAILGFANQLQSKEISEGMRENYINIIQERGKYLLRIIDDIVDVTKIEANQLDIYKERFNLNDLLNEIKDRSQQFIESSGKEGLIIMNNYALEDKNSFIVTDKIRLEQIISNLMSNAIKFSNVGYIEMGYMLDNKDNLEFFVKDTGMGIPYDKQHSIFDRFNQGEGNFAKTAEGAGLGLSISKNLVELLGGYIWFKSQVNQGTIFYFTIPFVRAIETGKEKEKPDKQKLLAEPDWENFNLLVVEDDERSFDLMAESFNPLGVNILHAENGEEAVKMAKEHPELDLILMDIRLPRMNGYEATKAIREFNKEIPIIAQTAYAMERDRVDALEAGCNDYLAKPVDFLKLIKLIKKYSN